MKSETDAGTSPMTGKFVIAKEIEVKVDDFGIACRGQRPLGVTFDSGRSVGRAETRGTST